MSTVRARPGYYVREEEGLSYQPTAPQTHRGAEAINRAIMEGKAVIDAREISVIDEHEHASKKASCFFFNFCIKLQRFMVMFQCYCPFTN